LDEEFEGVDSQTFTYFKSSTIELTRSCKTVPWPADFALHCRIQLVANMITLVPSRCRIFTQEKQKGLAGASLKVMNKLTHPQIMDR
jgi:hypothetical protein